MPLAIALDGPAGAGKSTLAKLVASQIGATYLDTGAMYRCVALFAYRNDLDDKTLSERLEEISIFFEGDQVFLNGENVSKQIREEHISAGASHVATIAEVRSYLVKLQREIGNSVSIIMDGRDIGTVVLPDAQVKIFLIASVDERAQRRYQQLLDAGKPADLEKIRQDIIDRDHQDSTRAVSPLRKAEDAVELDTTGQSIEESVKAILKQAEPYLVGGNAI